MPRAHPKLSGYDRAVRAKSMYSAASSGLANMIVLSSRWIMRAGASTRVLGVGEHDRPVVQVDHAAVVRGHVLLELRGVVVTRLLAKRLGDVVVVEVHPAGCVDPDHRR